MSDHAALALQLAEADSQARALLLASHAAQATELGWALKELYDRLRISQPSLALGAAATLTDLAHLTHQTDVQALAAWTSGRAALQLDGQTEQALDHLEQAIRLFEQLKQPQLAATVQVNRLHALALLGRYDEALECGLQARAVLQAHHDLRVLGQIEQNIGNLYLRRDRYREAEQFYRTARQRFLDIQDEVELARVENNLAYTLSLSNQPRAAAALYEQALARAEQAGLTTTQAEIECNLGNLSLFQGRYDQALDYLERSRRRYTSLGMPHEMAIADLELAEAYLELNLAPEAAAIAARVAPTFEELGMRAEQAQAQAVHGSARLLIGQFDAAQPALAAAKALYIAEGNAVGAAGVRLLEAQLAYAQQEYALALQAATDAEQTFAQAGARRRTLLAHWLRGEAARALGDVETARTLLTEALAQAEQQRMPQIAQRCLTSKGLLAASEQRPAEAEHAFQQAIALIENLRAPLPAEEFHTAFIADKLTPYTELVRLCLDDPQGERVMEALNYLERARSRALLELLDGTLPLQHQPRDPFEAELHVRANELREELNWFYSQINRPPDGGVRTAEAQNELYEAAHEREQALTEILRQLQQRGDTAPNAPNVRHYAASSQQTSPQYLLEQLQSALGSDTALIEYFSLDDELLAFVVTDAGVTVARNLAQQSEVETLVEELRFQIETLRYGMERLRSHLAQIEQRVHHFLRMLYDRLLGPLRTTCGERRLVLVPHRALHYVPFHALHDGEGYVIERREVSYTPSAWVLLHSIARPTRPPNHAVLLGAANEQIPRVNDEIATLAPLFPTSVTLLDQQATLAALRTHAADADVLHLACHGQFRPDNPLFSALQLGEGWLTVRDAYSLQLDGSLVTLSACETGISAVAPGDELLGLARGFFSAGALSLIVSLWTVDDDSTAKLMQNFYQQLSAGQRPAAALRFAQRELLAQQLPPFFWSPFILLGRW